MFMPGSGTPEAALLVYSAVRVTWALVNVQPLFSTVLMCIAVVLVLIQRVPYAKRWITSSAPGTKPSQSVTVFHGLLAFPCLLASLAIFCPVAWPIAWLSLEASVCMGLWSCTWTPLKTISLMHIPMIKVVHTVFLSDLTSQSQLYLCLQLMSSGTGGTLAPAVLGALHHYMPSTFTLGESMMITHLLMTTSTAAMHLLWWLQSASPTVLDESQAAITFTLVFGVVATIGTAALGAVPLKALPWDIHDPDIQTYDQDTTATLTSSSDTTTNTTNTTNTLQDSMATGSAKRKSTHSTHTSMAAHTGSGCATARPGQHVKLVRSASPMWAQVVWVALVLVAAAAAVTAAAWVLLVFLPGRIPAPDDAGVYTSHKWCDSGLSTAAVAAAAARGLPGTAQGLLAQRLSILLYWVVVLLGCLIVQAWLVRDDQGQTQNKWKPALIIVRKGYHALALILFIPVLAWDPNMLVVSLGVAWGVLVLLELCRVQRVPIIGTAVHQYMSGFVDERDTSGHLYMTHLALMLGLAAPVWLSSGVTSHFGSHTGDHRLNRNSSVNSAHGHGIAATASSITEMPGVISSDSNCVGCVDTTFIGWWLVAVSGMTSIGVGDAVASVIGNIWGRHRLHAQTKKTWEGTCSGAAAMLLCTAWVMHGRIPIWQLPSRFLVDVCVHVVLSAVLEALTLQLDNLVVPMWHTTWMMLCVAACER